VEIRFGPPLDTLLRTAAERRGDVLVVGARSTSGLERALLGSVSAGALNHSPIPVLVIR
jgi:nucleotide-binding universal stress UspA family protein